MELLCRIDDGLDETLCVRVRGELSEDGIVVGLLRTTRTGWGSG